MKNISIPAIVRVLFGIVLLLLGYVNFIQSTPLPGTPEAHMAFEQALIDAGYVTKVVGVIEFVAGLMLVFNRYAALGLLLIAPLSVNFVLFKVVLDPGTFAPIPFVYAFLNAYLAWTCRDKYKALFEPR